VRKLFAKGTTILARKNSSAINNENLRILVIGGKRWNSIIITRYTIICKAKLCKVEIEVFHLEEWQL